MATVVATVVVLGTASMWDLTVSNAHDFAVGTGQFVAHNCTDLVAGQADLQSRCSMDA